MDQFPIVALHKCFEKLTLARGQNYLKEGRVISVEVAPESSLKNKTVKFQSSVLGSIAKHPYEQIFIIKLEKDQSLSMASYCSCPLGGDCKHVAAAALQAYGIYFADNDIPLYPHKPSGLSINSQETSHRVATSIIDETTSYDYWIAEFSNAGTTAKIPTTTDEVEKKGFLAFVFDPRYSKLAVDIKLVKRTKAGKLGAGRQLMLERLNDSYNSYPDLTLSPQEEQAVGLYTRCCRGHYNGLSSSPILPQCLQAMLDTGHCYNGEDRSRPLRLGAPRALDIAWRETERNKNNKRIVASVQPAADLFLTYPPIYLDTKTYEVGVVETTLTEKQVELLKSPPDIAKEKTELLANKMILNPALSVLPAPAEIKAEVIDIQDTPPTPLLILKSEQGDTLGVMRHFLQIQFKYQTTVVSALRFSPISYQKQQDALYRVHRQKEAEQAVVDYLLNLGFSETSVLGDAKQLNFQSISLNDTPLKSLMRMQQFLEEEVPELQAKGWQIEIDRSFNLSFINSDQSWVLDIEQTNNDWFELGFDLAVDDDTGHRSIPLLPLLIDVLASFDKDDLPEKLLLDAGDSQYIKIDRQQIQPVLDLLYQLFDRPINNGKISLSRFDAALLQDLDNTAMRWNGGERLRLLSQKLADFKGIIAVDKPKGLNATLRDYQQQGLNWLAFLREYDFAGVLADDMGLGKTIQTLGLLLHEKEHGRLAQPALIIAPTSLMSNWKREAEKFAPELRVLILQGQTRKQFFDEIANFDIVLSTYPLLIRDEDILKAQHFHYLILDEAQTIKNTKAKMAQVVRLLNATHRLCLTGTPMENHLGELWALFDFLMPNFLGNQAWFKTHFRTPIESHGDSERSQQLAKRIAPFMLRRTKDQVAKELPEKSEIIRTVTLGKKQAALYESIRLSLDKRISQTIANKGLARSHIEVLDALLKLRQTCCDPRLLKLEQKEEYIAADSAKLELLMDMLPEMLSEGRKVLIFSQFTQMLGLIENELKARDIGYSKLTGQTRNREAVINQFKAGETSVFLISLKAGGVGLNLTEADTVIHYDPWWNPAVENQATDRAHRIGQEKPVFVYKLVTEGTLEEKILKMQASKQLLANSVYGKTQQQDDVSLTLETLQALLAPLEQA